MKVKLDAKFYEEKARNELNETEIRKEQAMQQLKEMLSKHPFIRHEFADFGLLAMLRTTKYSVDRAFERIEKILIAFKLFLQPQIPIEDVFRKKDVVYVLKERDETGCRVLLFDYKNVPPEDYVFVDSVLNLATTCLVLARENETQICGIKAIYDFRHLKKGHVKKALEADLVNIFLTSEAFFLRIKEVKVIGLPTFAVAFLEMILCGLKTKLKNRIVFAKKLDPELTDDDIEDIRERIFEKEYDKTIFNLNFDMEAMKKHTGCELVGSFRKLEID